MNVYGRSAPFRYYREQCYENCANSDPTQKFSLSDNRICIQQCDNDIDKMIRTRSGPPGRLDTSIQCLSKIQCVPQGVGVKQTINTCYNDSKRNKVCEQNCHHSSLPFGQCMAMCNAREKNWFWNPYEYSRDVSQLKYPASLSGYSTTSKGFYIP